MIIFLYTSFLLILVVLFFVHIFYFRKKVLVSALRNEFSDWSFDENAHGHLNSPFSRYAGINPVLVVTRGQQEIVLARKLLSEAIKYQWYLVISTDAKGLGDGFYSDGFLRGYEIKVKKIYETVEPKSKLNLADPITSAAKFVEISQGVALNYFEIGSVFGTSTIRAVKQFIGGMGQKNDQLL